MNDSVKKLLKESMWDLATCANDTSVVPILQSICRWSGIFLQGRNRHAVVPVPAVRLPLKEKYDTVYRRKNLYAGTGAGAVFVRGLGVRPVSPAAV